MRRPDLGTQTGLNPKPWAGSRSRETRGKARGFGGLRRLGLGLHEGSGEEPLLLAFPAAPARGLVLLCLPGPSSGQASGPSMCPEPGPVASGRPGFHGDFAKVMPPGLLEPSEVTILEASAAPASSGEWKDPPPTMFYLLKDRVLTPPITCVQGLGLFTGALGAAPDQRGEGVGEGSGSNKIFTF